MTKRTRRRAAFKRLRRRAVEVDFQGGTLTTDSGLLLLREADRKLGLIDRINAAIPDPRDLRYVAHPQREMLVSRIFGIATGYEDGNDHAQLRYDPAMQVAAQREPDAAIRLASPSTLSRLENRVDSKTMFALHEILVDTFLDSYDEPPEEIILDLDATDDPTHGNQEKRYFNGFYNGYCFLPLYVFCGNQILVSYLRPSSVGAAKHARPISKLLVEKIRSRWPNVRIILRGDSGFCNGKLMRWCDKNRVGYIFGFQQNPALKRHLVHEMVAAHAAFQSAREKQRRFTWFSYKARRWDRHRWVIGKAEHTAKGSNPRFVVTNLPEAVAQASSGNSPAANPERFYETLYCPRGEMENRIKEQQLCLFADRTSCTDFMANQFRLMLASFAYVLLDAVRRIGLAGTEASHWRVDTIRLRLLKIAARVRVTARRVVFHLASSCPYERLFNHVAERLCDTS
ncbi:IS1380 family transposase [Candidatus Laterigemmans baculatus]|uniref:IS1380 family transposase n=1 Tax=Candidatus Laterigemmans baculatus TaxID=2770505 RepID=UPI0013D917A9|nr:IS1380 family transposase [Candidatus Laterigemmans baculatus]